MSVVIQNLSAGYGEKVVLHDINLNFRGGGIWALLGKNGSGKTTLFRCIGALLRPKLGEVRVAGTKINNLERREIASLVSLVPQKTTSVFSYSVLDMVLMAENAKIRAWERPEEDAIRRAMEACAEVGITHLLDRNYGDLSGGEQQLVLIARGIMQDTPVMLLDEPISHLDFRNQHQIMNLLTRLVQEKGVTVIVTLHDPNIAVLYCDHVVMLDQGAVVAAGKMKELFTDINLRRLYGDIVATDQTTRGLRIAVPDF